MNETVTSFPWKYCIMKLENTINSKKKQEEIKEGTNEWIRSTEFSNQKHGTNHSVDKKKHQLKNKYTKK